MLQSKHILLTLICAIISFSLFGQNSKRAYKQLEKKDFEKAHELFKENLAENENDIPAHFGLALLYSNEGFSGKDYLQAWNHADITNKNLSKLTAEELEMLTEYFTNTEERRSSRPVKKKIELAIEEMEDKLIRLVREGNDLEIVNQVIQQFPDFSHYQNAIHIRNYLEYRAAEKENTVESFNRFINKYPEAAQVQVAVEKRNQLIFEEAKKMNTILAMENFINSYPKARELSQAIRIRNKLAFEQTKQKNTVEAFERFINTYPDALEVMDAKLLQKELIYQRAKKIKSLEAFNEFISRYPEGGQYVDIFNLKSAELGKALLQKNKYPGTGFTWARVFDNNSRKDICGAVSTIGESIVLAGNTEEDTTNFTNSWILFLESDGTMQWNKQVGDGNNDIVKEIGITSLGELIFGGYTHASMDTMDGQAWLFKMNTRGDKIWNRVLGSVETTGIAINDRNDIIVGGYNYSGDSLLQPHYFVTRLTENGKRLWNREYLNTGKIVDVSQQTGNEIVTGGGQWLFKTDVEGYLVWEAYRDTTDSISTIYANENAVCAAGKRDSLDIFISQYSKDGKENWTKSFTFETKHNLKTSVIHENGNIFVGGTAGDDLVIMQLSPAGEILNTIMFGTTEHQISLESLRLTKSNELLISGTTSTPDGNEKDIFLLKYTL